MQDIVKLCRQFDNKGLTLFCALLVHQQHPLGAVAECEGTLTNQAVCTQPESVRPVVGSKHICMFKHCVRLVDAQLPDRKRQTTEQRMTEQWTSGH